MKEYTLNIGEVKSFSHPVTLTCYGLGSCVGLFVQDRAKGISGGAHILLPEGENALRFYSSDNTEKAIAELLRQFKAHGSDLTALRAKLTGGASVFKSALNTGARNVESVKKQLIQHKIYIAADDTGGDQGRTARFDARSGKVLVRTTPNNDIKIL